jgi:hypothetical protein
MSVCTQAGEASRSAPAPVESAPQFKNLALAAESKKAKERGNLAALRPGLDLLPLLVKAMQAHYSDRALFFYDASGGTTIGVALSPKVKQGITQRRSCSSAALPSTWALFCVLAVQAREEVEFSYPALQGAQPTSAGVCLFPRT